MTNNSPDAWLISLFDMIDNGADYLAEVKATEAVKATEKAEAAAKAKACLCGRCGGSDMINQYRRVNGGVCFKCNGTGVAA